MAPPVPIVFPTTTNTAPVPDAPLQDLQEAVPVPVRVPLGFEHIATAALVEADKHQARAERFNSEYVPPKDERLLAHAPADRLLALATPAELAALSAEPEEEGDACEQVAPRERHEPSQAGLALALAPLRSRPDRKRAAGRALGSMLNTFKDDEDGDHMDVLQSVEDLFGEGEVENEHEWLLAARELLQNPACRQPCEPRVQVLNIQVNNNYYFAGGSAQATAAPPQKAPPQKAPSHIQKRFLVLLYCKSTVERRAVTGTHTWLISEVLQGKHTVLVRICRLRIPVRHVCVTVSCPLPLLPEEHG